MNELIDLMKNNNIKYVYSDNKIVIYNSNNNRFIEIILDDDEYIVSFETQHCHFDDIEDIIDYINRIMNDEILPIEFYKDNKRKFGGDISKELFNNLSIKSLVKYFGFDEETLSNFEYEIYSWSGDFDIKRERVSNLKGE